MKKLKTTKWVGFTDGKLHFYFDNYYEDVKKAEIFKTKSDAKKCFEDVRKIEIKEV